MVCSFRVSTFHNGWQHLPRLFLFCYPRGVDDATGWTVTTMFDEQGHRAELEGPLGADWRVVLRLVPQDGRIVVSELRLAPAR